MVPGRWRSSWALAGVRERVDPADHDLEVAGGDRREELLDSLAQLVRAGEEVHEPEADDRAARRHQLAGVDRVRVARGDPEGDEAAERRQRREAGVEGAPPAISSTTSTRSPPFASMICSFRFSARLSTAASAPRRIASSRFSSDDASAMTRPAPNRFASCTASVPVPPPGGADDHGFARLEPGGDAQHRARGEALEQDRGGLVVGDAVRDRDERGLGDRDQLGIAAARRGGRRPAARPAVVPLISPPGMNGSSASARYSSRRWWVSAKLMPARATSTSDLALGGLGIGQLDTARAPRGHRTRIPGSRASRAESCAEPARGAGRRAACGSRRPRRPRASSRSPRSEARRCARREAALNRTGAGASPTMPQMPPNPGPWAGWR